MHLSKAVSLSELLVGIAVLGLAASFSSLSLIDVLPKIRVEQAIRAVGALLEWCRIKAVMEGSSYVVVFSPATQRIEVFRDQDMDGPEDHERVRTLDLAREYSGTVFGAVPGTYRTGSCLTVDPSGMHIPYQRVAFLSSGTTDRCGSLYLMPQKDYPHRKDRMRALSIILATGRVQLWRFNPYKADVCGGHGGWEPF